MVTALYKGRNQPRPTATSNFFFKRFKQKDVANEKRTKRPDVRWGGVHTNEWGLVRLLP